MPPFDLRQFLLLSLLSGSGGGLFNDQEEAQTPAAVQDFIRRQALLRAGLTGLLATGRGEGLLSTIGQAGLAGLDTEATLTAAFAQAFPGGEPETAVVERADGSKILIDKATGRLIAELTPPEEREEDRPEFETPTTVELPGGDVVLATFDPRLGAFRELASAEGRPGRILVNARPVSDSSPVRGVPVTVAGPDGQPQVVFVDPTTGAQIGPARGGIAKQQGQQAALGNLVDASVDEMERILVSRGFRPFGPVETAVGRGLGNEAVADFTRALTSSEFQQFEAAAQSALAWITKSISGAQASDKEVQRLRSFVVPRPGESPETVKRKLERLRQTANMLRNGQDPFDLIRGNRGAANATSGPAGRFSDLTR